MPLKDTIHCLPVRIYYEDTDFSGLVYHANYVKFAERGRSDFLREIGVHHTEILSRTPPLAFAVLAMNMAFVQAAHIDEMLEVQTAYTELRGARLNGFQCILRGDTLIWHSTIAAAIINTQSGRASRIPADIAEKVTPHLTHTLPTHFGF